jgi:hypothetical protein
MVWKPVNESAKVPYLGWWHQGMMRTSLHCGALLKVNCPISHKLLAPTPYLSPLSFQTHMPAHEAQFQLWKMPSVPRKPTPPGTIDEKEKRNE